MEDSNNPNDEAVLVEKNIYTKSLSVIKSKSFILSIIGAVSLIVLSVFLTNGTFISATVNGSPISRYSVIRELERGNKKAVIAMEIEKKLILSEMKKNKIVITSDEVTAELKKIDDQFITQNTTLKIKLEEESLSEKDFKKKVVIKLGLTKLLADKLVVNDAEITAFITKNKIALPKGMTTDIFRKEVGLAVSGEKFEAEAQKLLVGLKKSAVIKYY